MPVLKLRKDTNNGQIQEAPLEQASNEIQIVRQKVSERRALFTTAVVMLSRYLLLFGGENEETKMHAACTFEKKLQFRKKIVAVTEVWICEMPHRGGKCF